MLPFNSDELRSRLTADFGSLANGATDALVITHVLDTITHETARILRDLVMQWSAENNILRRLPDELLARCFTCLPLKYRMDASHVSRHWRAVALGFPAVWADIDVDGFQRQHRNEVVRMALARTGNHPVSIENSIIPPPDPHGIFSQCLRDHLHHIQHISWNIPVRSLPVRLPAPILETLRLAGHLNIPVDFLGGVPQRLRTIGLYSVSFPDSCPALSTVTDLSLNGASTLEHARTYSQLFGLFPALQSLSLWDLRPEFSHFLPAGAAPASLRKLKMTTDEDEVYSLIPHYAAWRTDALLVVELDHETTELDQLDEFISGAAALNITLYPMSKTSITAYGPGADRVRSVSFLPDRANAAATLARLFRGIPADNLRAVRSLQLPLSALAALLPAFPSLQHLGVRFEAHLHWWDALAQLLCAKDLCPIELIVERMDFDSADNRAPLTSDDAEALLAQLAALGRNGLTGVSVKGFSRETVADIDVSAVAAFDVSFNTSL
ncbi:hypothetical protein AURDEDRAFT_187255 [Auricularia subglabra TFB-10046 SS5]|uniref:F-box domain-containing protein n=1 Tax=Auricularia subglabra (strain TFB-10046 / SS5) TaxID=717982 RepID=J0LJ77_AURST|nr:hypothetical protein AURDEDRAFT_187255 [Auricularia subglabra TFB-10046 SS5]